MLQGQAKLIADGLTNKDPTVRAAGALAFAVHAVEKLVELAVTPNADPAKALGEIAFPMMNRDVLKELLK